MSALPGSSLTTNLAQAAHVFVHMELLSVLSQTVQVQSLHYYILDFA